ncbi:hypothetical protein FACS1894172_13250 [Spirochaetia bacterium]|nr:hypothetical protein FACS1894164_14250 [Spirochaetia bacterium]GHU33860.1 hypothetical protein FACS1894172_13250 [Spirochaetia bacterium]
MLRNRLGLQENRQAFEKALASEKKKILVCAGTGASGSVEIYKYLIRLMQKKIFLV